MLCDRDRAGYYDLTLEEYEQRRIAELLVQLAIVEPGEVRSDCAHGRRLVSRSSLAQNWVDEDFNNIVGWELPATWVDNVPRKGHLTLNYTSAAENGCAPVWAKRQAMCGEVLCESCPAEEIMETDLSKLMRPEDSAADADGEADDEDEDEDEDGGGGGAEGEADLVEDGDAVEEEEWERETPRE